MRIILFRHGPAGHADPAVWHDDRERPLTPRGEERTRRAARGLSRLEANVSSILTSPLRRAEDTARLLAEALDSTRVETLEALVPGGSSRKVIESLSRAKPDETIVLVGHEPDLGKLAGTLLFGAPAALPIKKAGACAIRFEGAVEPGAGRLQWFVTPRMLRRMAGKHVRS